MGEEAVRRIFPETTIVRPAPMFGFEDRLLHKLAGVTNLFTANHMQQRFWPVHVSSQATVFKPLSFLAIRLTRIHHLGPRRRPSPRAHDRRRQHRIRDLRAVRAKELLHGRDGRAGG